MEISEMARCRVRCCDPDDSDRDRRIEGIGGQSSNGRWYREIDKAISDIEKGINEFYVKVDDEEVDVIVRTRNGVKYITTEADGFPPNNLLNLPACP
jgi:hypothetical protein